MTIAVTGGQPIPKVMSDQSSNNSDAEAAEDFAHELQAVRDAMIRVRPVKAGDLPPEPSATQTTDAVVQVGCEGRR